MKRSKYWSHPLRSIFRARCYTPNHGLNWLQEHGHISDNCVTVEDVAPVDVERVLGLFRKRWSTP